MKTNKFLALIAIVSLVFTSCSSDEIETIEDSSKGLIKTYKIKRDSTGAYSLDFDVIDNTQIDRLEDSQNNSSKFLLSSTSIPTEKSISKDLLVDNNELKVSFVDANADSKFISIIDDNITLQAKGDSSKLSGYSVEGNEDGTFSLDFDVNNNVDVSFVYNESISTYEIHLEDGSGSVSSFSRILEKEDDGLLKIDFVNHISNSGAKSATSALIRKPKVIIDGGD